MENIKVLIADDHPLIREGLSKILSLEPSLKIVGQAENGEVAIKQTKELKPNVILMDINMPVMGGIEASRIIKKECPETNIIALTVNDDNDIAIEVIKAGATGYVLKDVAPDVLIAAIKTVYAGETVIHSKVTDKIFEEMAKTKEEKALEDRASRDKTLTERETDILKLISEGLSNKEIANSLFISEKTVKNHLTNLFRKIEVCDRTQAVLYAIKAKLVKVDKN